MYSVGGLALGTLGAIATDPDPAIEITNASGGITMPEGAEFEGLTPFAVEVWVRATGARGLGMVVDHERHDVGRGGWLLRADDKATTIERWANDTSCGLTGPALTIGKWRHVVAVLDGVRQYLFIDGERVAEDAASFPIPRISRP